MSTHTIFFGLFLVAAISVLVAGLVVLLRDLLGRNAEDAALIKDDGLTWPRRYQGSAPGPTIRE